MWVVLSKFSVAEGPEKTEGTEMADAVKQAFVDRPHQVDAVLGFLRMDVISPIEQPGEIWLLTYWENEARYRQWYRTHAYQAAHETIPRGLKLLPQSTEIRFFQHIAS